MGKNNKIAKYYAHRKGESQLFSVKASSDEEAAKLFEEKLGTEDFVYGKKLPSAQPKVAWKETHKIMSDIMGEDFANFADKMHSVGAI